MKTNDSMILRADASPVSVRNAVIGFVDIVNSTVISNNTTIETDWNIKREFHASSRRLAAELNVVILNETGDGFVFLANPSGELDWAARFECFQLRLVAAFREILNSLSDYLVGIESGLRFGIACGPILVSHTHGHDFASVAGRVVNLAARLCACAPVDGLSADESTTVQLRQTAKRLKYVATEARALKGFETKVVCTQFRESNGVATTPTLLSRVRETLRAG